MRQELSDASLEARHTEYLQPVVIIRGQATHHKDGFLAMEKMLLSMVNVEYIPVLLFAAYYVFNMQYCNGCANVFSFLEVLFLNASPPRRSKLKNFLHSLDNIEIDQ